MVSNLKVAYWVNTIMPDMGVQEHGKSRAFIIGSKYWRPFLKGVEIEILTNFISHEDVHLTLHKMAENQASRLLDNFPFPMKTKNRVDTEKLREMEIAENTGLELIVWAIEKSHRKAYKGRKQG